MEDLDVLGSAGKVFDEKTGSKGMEDHGVLGSADKVFDEKTGSKRGRAEEKGGVGRLEKRPSGVVVPVSERHNGDEMINGVKYEEEKKVADGGLFNQLITNLVSSPRVNDQVKSGGGFGEQVAVEEGDSAGGGGGGGVINSLISNIFHQNGSGGGGTGGGETAEHGRGDEEEKKDGGVIDEIVKQLPRTLSEDAVPAPPPDEAAILIHSIIHD